MLPVGIATAGSHVCVAGTFGDANVPGQVLSLGGQNLTTQGGTDIFAGCLAPDGSAALWTTRLGDGQSQQLTAMRGDGANVLYVGGATRGSLGLAAQDVASTVGAPFVAFLDVSSDATSWGLNLMPNAPSDVQLDRVNAVAGHGHDALLVTGAQVSDMAFGGGVALPAPATTSPFVAQVHR